MPLLPDYDDDQGGMMQIEMVSEQPMHRRRSRPVRALARPSIVWLGRTTEPGMLTTITLAIAGVRYEYDLLPHSADNAEHIAKRSAGKALAYIKRQAKSWRKL